MMKETARTILQRMLEGIDLVTGEVLPQGHLCHEPDVIRALHLAIMSLQEKKALAEELLNRKNGLPNAGRPWTDEETEELIRLYRTGASMEEICQTLARRERGVNKQLAQLGLKELQQANEKKEKSKDKPPEDVLPGLERAGKAWTAEEDKLLHNLAEDKWPVEEIARAMHRTEYSIFCHMEKLDIYGDVPGYPVYDGLPKWSKEDVLWLREMHKRGKTLREKAGVRKTVKEQLNYFTASVRRGW